MTRSLAVYFVVLFVVLSSVHRARAASITVYVSGSVERAGSYELDEKEATLSSLLERAGGIAAKGSDLIRILSKRPDGRIDSETVIGREFYAGSVDIALSEFDGVVVLECVGLGLGREMLSDDGFADLQAKRRDFLKRKQEGKVGIQDREKAANQALQTTPMTRSVYEKTIEFGHPQRGV